MIRQIAWAILVLSVLALPLMAQSTGTGNACLATPASNNRVNVRTSPERGAEVLTRLVPGLQSFVMSEVTNTFGEVWYEIQTPEGTGFVASITVTLQGVCDALDSHPGIATPRANTAPSDSPLCVSARVDDTSAVANGVVLDNFAYDVAQGVATGGARYFPNEDNTAIQFYVVDVNATATASFSFTGGTSGSSLQAYVFNADNETLLNEIVADGNAVSIDLQPGRYTFYYVVSGQSGTLLTTCTPEGGAPAPVATELPAISESNESLCEIRSGEGTGTLAEAVLDSFGYAVDSGVETADPVTGLIRLTFALVTVTQPVQVIMSVDGDSAVHSLMLAIYDNSFNEVFSEEIQANNAIIVVLEPGSYYWQIQTNNLEGFLSVECVEAETAQAVPTAVAAAEPVCFVDAANALGTLRRPGGTGAVLDNFTFVVNSEFETVSPFSGRIDLQFSIVTVTEPTTAYFAVSDNQVGERFHVIVEDNVENRLADIDAQVGEVVAVPVEAGDYTWKVMTDALDGVVSIACGANESVMTLPEPRTITPLIGLCVIDAAEGMGMLDSGVLDDLTYSFTELQSVADVSSISTTLGVITISAPVELNYTVTAGEIGETTQVVIRNLTTGSAFTQNVNAGLTYTLPVQPDKYLFEITTNMLDATLEFACLPLP